MACDSTCVTRPEKAHPQAGRGLVDAMVGIGGDSVSIWGRKTFWN